MESISEKKPDDDIAEKQETQTRKMKPAFRRSWRGVRAPREKTKQLTHFLCMVTAKDTILTEALSQTQDKLIARFNLPSEIRVNVVDDLHLTLLTLHLPTPEDEAKVIETVTALQHLGPPSGIPVKMQSVGSFGKRVLWAKPHFMDEVALSQVVAWRQGILEALDDYMCDKRPWTPHATVMKTSRLRGSERKEVEITEEIVAEASSMINWELFEPILVNEITLLSCKKDEMGRYIRCGVVSFRDLETAS